MNVLINYDSDYSSQVPCIQKLPQKRTLGAQDITSWFAWSRRWNGAKPIDHNRPTLPSTICSKFTWAFAKHTINDLWCHCLRCASRHWANTCSDQICKQCGDTLNTWGLVWRVQDFESHHFIPSVMHLRWPPKFVYFGILNSNLKVAARNYYCCAIQLQF